MRITAREKEGWIGVDLDCTLAEYNDWEGPEHIGAPIMPMVNRVKRWIADGQEVRVFTARAFPSMTADSSIRAINTWCRKHIGTELAVTYMKDYNMIELWDDRAVQLIPNTGERVDGMDDA